MNRKLDPAHFESWADYYWEYQYRLAINYLVPLLSQWGVKFSGKTLLDVGCGQGGATCAFTDNGALCHGLDFSKKRIETAQAIAESRDKQISWHHGDILDANFTDILMQQFQIIIIRDVVEHINDSKRLFSHLTTLLEKDGVILLSFPPYFSPFGLHQQVLRNSWIKKIPYIQILPEFLWKHGVKGFLAEEVLQVMKVKLTIRKFMKSVDENGMKVMAKKGYFIRPTFELRYGLKCLDGNGIIKIPFLREILLTGVYFLLAPRKRRRKSTFS